MSDFYDYLTDPRVQMFRDFLSVKKYTSSDLGVAYRVINHWSELGLFNDSHQDQKESKWRRFSFSDIVWAEIIKELRKYGFSLPKLLKLKASIIDEPFVEPHSFEYRIFLTLAKTPVNLLVYENGFGVFIASSEQLTQEYIGGFLNKNLDKSSLIVIDLNRVVARLYPKKDLEPYFKKLAELSDSELGLIDFIRSNSFDEVVVVLRNGGIQRFEGKKNESLESDLLSIIKKNQYQKIEVLVAGNKVVRITQTVKEKPSTHGNKPAN